MLIEIKSDTMFVSKRLKEIDPSYYLVFNTIKGKYEVHSNNQVGCSYCLTCPHDALDSRLIELTKKTRRNNLKELLRQIDIENEKIQKQNQKKLLEELWQQNKF